MATDPIFAATPRCSSALPATAETNLQVPTNTVTVFTAGSSGSKVEEIVVEATATTLVATTVAGLVYLFVYDGTLYNLYDVVTVTAITASSTAPGFRQRNVYSNLILPSTHSLRAAQSVSGNASVLKVTALGADF